MLSRTNKEFIRSLFPGGDIYINLLPPAAQEVIGQIGPDSQGAARLLSSIGFRYFMRIDPFDGGPHYEANFEDISVIKSAHEGHLTQSHEQTNTYGLIGHFSPTMPSGKRFKAAYLSYNFDKASQVILLKDAHRRVLDLDYDSKIWALSLA